MDEGFELTFKDKACIIKDLVKVKLFIVGMRNKCFPLNWMDIKHTAYSCILADTEMWHRRFGHVNYGSLKLMAFYNLVEGSSGIFVDNFKAKMQTNFEMSDLRKMQYFLGMEINQGSELHYCIKKIMPQIC